MGEILGVGLPAGVEGDGVPEFAESGGSVMTGTGVALFSALTVATTLVSSGSFGNEF